jgi:hypothetical protein
MLTLHPLLVLLLLCGLGDVRAKRRVLRTQTGGIESPYADQFMDSVVKDADTDTARDEDFHYNSTTRRRQLRLGKVRSGSSSSSGGGAEDTVAKDREQHRVTSLPGLSAQDQSRLGSHFAGHLPCDAAASNPPQNFLFYWLFEKQESPLLAPITIWMNVSEMEGQTEINRQRKADCVSHHVLLYYIILCCIVWPCCCMY